MKMRLFLKYALQGIIVTDVNNPDGLEVPVRHILPEDELVKMTYPLITIAMTDIEFDPSRAHSGLIQLPYAPENSPAWWSPEATTYNPDVSPYRTDFPLPYNITYQISVYSNLVRDHNRAIISALMMPGMPLAARGSILHIPQNGTFERITLLGGPKTSYANVDVDGNPKRFIHSAALIQVSTEILNPVTNVSPGLYARATQFNVDLSAYSSIENINSWEITEAIGLVSSGTFAAWNTQ